MTKRSSSEWEKKMRMRAAEVLHDHYLNGTGAEIEYDLYEKKEDIAALITYQ